MPLGQVLLRQVGAAGDQAFVDVVVGNYLKQIIELRHAQALIDKGFKQAFALSAREAVGAVEFDGLDGEATGVHRSHRGCRFYLFAGQFLELLKTSLLLFQQSVLPITNQVLVARVGRGKGAIKGTEAQ